MIQDYQEKYNLPGEAFTREMEQFHSRVAMIALAVFFVAEGIKGSALL